MLTNHLEHGKALAAHVRVSVRAAIKRGVGQLLVRHFTTECASNIVVSFGFNILPSHPIFRAEEAGPTIYQLHGVASQANHPATGGLACDLGWW